MFDGVLDFFVSLWDWLSNFFSELFDTVLGWFGGMDLNGNAVLLALGMWLFCMLVMWKLMYDPTFMPVHTKIILSIAMLPISYLITSLMLNR